MKLDNNFNCSVYGRRATPKRYEKGICIEGEYVNTTDIAKRLGVSVDVARSRLKRAKTKDEAVTWNSLKRNPA